MTMYRANRWVRFGFRPSEDGPVLVARTIRPERSTFRLGDTSILRVIGYAASPRTLEAIGSFVTEELGADDETAAELVEFLRDRDFLVPAEAEYVVDGERPEGWEAAMGFHFATRNIEFADRNDADDTKDAVLSTYADEESPPDVYPAFAETELQELPEPSLETTAERDTGNPFAVTDADETDRILDDRALSSLLARTFDSVREIRDVVAAAGDDHPRLQVVSSPLLFEVYPVVLDCPGLSPGVYQYSIRDHALAPIPDRDFADGKSAADALEPVLGERVDPATTPVVVLFSACVARYQWRYRHARAFRNLSMEAAGHAQRFALVAATADRRAVPTPISNNDASDDLADLDGFEETIVYGVGLRN